MPYIGIPLLIGEELDRWLSRAGPRYWDGQGNWVQYHDCGKGFSDHFDAQFSEFYPSFNCLDNQAMGFASDMGLNAFPPVLVPEGTQTLILGHGHVLFGGVFWAINNNIWFDRIGGTEAVAPPRLRTRVLSPPGPPLVDVPPGIYGPAEPNIERRLRRGVGTPLGVPSETPPMVEPFPAFRVEIEPTLAPGLAITPSLTPVAEVEPSVRFVPGKPTPPPAPPRSNEKEKKVLTKGKMAVVVGFRILDFVSELGDMVEAIYSALPRATRRAFEREERRRRGLAPGASLERPGDQLGQYGINGADWRLRALWRHWDELDAPNAVYNLIANEVEDAAYGRAYAARDRLIRFRQHGRTRSPIYRDRGI